MNKNSSFSNKVAIVTGSSQGIGKAIAIALAKEGAYIVLNGRNQERLSEAETELKVYTSNVISICADVSSIPGSQELIDNTIKRFNKIDILINNVGVSMRGSISEINPEVFKERAEQSRRIKCKLVKVKGTRIFLDELLETDKGGKMKSYDC